MEEQAQQRMDVIVKQMKAVEGITEELKSDDQMKWVRKMNNIQARAEEIVREEIIYRL